MADAYSTRFYNTTAAAPQNSPKDGYPHHGKAGLMGCAFSETIATTSLDANTDRFFCFPMPGIGTTIGQPGTYRLLGFWLKSDDLDAGGGAALDLDLVMVYTANGVEVVDATPLYDASALGAFSAAIAMKWVDINRLIPVADNGLVHAVLRCNTAASTAAAGNVTILPQWV